jgi:folate-dependent phosphoribosylglycinamide formyltransferase PurN
MEKFISVPVTGQPNQLISVTGIVLVESSSATSTTTTISYQANGRDISITHAAQVGYDMRTAIQNAIAAALQTSWTNVVYVASFPRAISSVVVSNPV